jgi:hypothetical protein
MHFAMQHDASDTTGAQSQAQALVNLTDPNALAGMTDTEKSEVVNFIVPASHSELMPGRFFGAAGLSSGWLLDSPLDPPGEYDACGFFNPLCAPRIDLTTIQVNPSRSSTVETAISGGPYSEKLNGFLNTQDHNK